MKIVLTPWGYDQLKLQKSDASELAGGIGKTIGIPAVADPILQNVFPIIHG